MSEPDPNTVNVLVFKQAAKDGVLIDGRGLTPQLYGRLAHDVKLAMRWGVTVEEYRVYARKLAALNAETRRLCQIGGYDYAIRKRAPGDTGPATLEESLEEHRRFNAELEAEIEAAMDQERRNQVRKIKRWHQEGLTVNEMYRRLGGKRLDTLKFIAQVLGRYQR